MKKKPTILVTGASGYIGGRLVENLLKLGYSVVSMVRRPEQFAKLFSDSSPVSSRRHIIRYGNTLEPESLSIALKGVDVAYYLVHSLANNKNFESLEIQSARNFVKAAEQCKVKKIIYLGGLSNDDEQLSAHLRSRKAVGVVLRESKIPSITFRASIILGSGSISYELIRNLTERLPIMITPKWVRVKAQPIGVGDVLRYLIAGIDISIKKYRIYEIGGIDQVSYSDIMLEYARQRGLKRLIIPVPVLTPYLSSLWLSVFTPLYSSIGKKLIDGIKIATVVKDQQKTFRDFAFRPMSMSEAIKKAIEREEQEFIRTHWASSYSSSISETTKIGDWQEQKQGTKLVYTKKSVINSSCKDAFLVLEQIGGKKGWYYANFIWKLRGLMDILLGGPGHQRGRKNPYKLQEGEFLDWWRVEQYKPPQLLRLRAEMKLPGRAWLEFEINKKDQDNCELFLSAIFDPSGLFGLLYWYSLYPVHFFIFNGLLRGLKQDIEASTKTLKNA